MQRELAQVLGAIGTAAAVPALQALLRKGDPRVLKAVVPALSGIDDPSAARALATVLRSVTGEARAAVVAALMAVKDVRVVPMLARILDESAPLGPDFDMVMETLDAVASFRDDRAIRSITKVARQRRWLSPRRTGRLRRRALGALTQIATPAAAAAVDGVAKTGDWQLRRLARAAKKTA